MKLVMVLLSSIPIWPIIHNAYPSLVFTVIGPNAPETISKYNNTNNIEVLGFVDDVTEDQRVQQGEDLVDRGQEKRKGDHRQIAL